MAILLGWAGSLVQASLIMPEGSQNRLGDPEVGEIKASGDTLEEPGLDQDVSRWLTDWTNREEAARKRLEPLEQALREGRYEDALALIREEAGELFSRYERAIWEARLLIELGRLADAEAILMPILRQGSADESQVGLLLALARMEAGNWAGAREILLPMASRSLPLDALLIQVAARARSAPDAIGWRGMLRQARWEEADARVLHHAAVLLFDGKDFESAAIMARRAMGADPEYAEGHFMLGSSLLSLGRPEEARNALLDAVRIRPDYPQALGNLAIAHYQLGKEPLALLMLIEALERKIDYSDGWGNYLTMLARELLPREGLDALPLPPEGEEVAPAVWHWQAAMTAMESDDAQRSVRHFLRSLSLNLNDPNVHNDFAVLLERTDRKPLALPFLRAAAVLAPGSALVRENLEQLSREVDRQFLELQVEALVGKLTREDSAADRLVLAMLYEQLDRQDEAMEQLRMAVELDPESSEYRFELAQGFSRRGKFAEALESFLPILEADPENPRWMFRVAWLLLQNQPSPGSRELEQAVDLARRSCELTEYRRRDCLELLARALVASGDSDQARAMQEKADALEKPVSESDQRLSN